MDKDEVGRRELRFAIVDEDEALAVRRDVVAPQRVVHETPLKEHGGTTQDEIPVRFDGDQI